jgi:hypothetical protein
MDKHTKKMKNIEYEPRKWVPKHIRFGQNEDTYMLKIMQG